MPTHVPKNFHTYTYERMKSFNPVQDNLVTWAMFSCSVVWSVDFDPEIGFFLLFWNWTKEIRI